MKSKISLFLLCALSLFVAGCGRHVRTAVDVTPGNASQKLDWRYGAGDIRIQTTKITREIFDRWYCKTNHSCENGKPRLIITQIDNCTDQFIATDMIRDIIEGVAIDDGRFTVVAGNAMDENELDQIMAKISCHPKYSSSSSRPKPGQATAPDFLAKIRITKAVTQERFCTYEDYRMTVTLYDIETQEAIDSAWDVLRKKVYR